MPQQLDRLSSLIRWFLIDIWIFSERVHFGFFQLLKSAIGDCRAMERR